MPSAPDVNLFKVVQAVIGKQFLEISSTDVRTGGNQIFQNGRKNLYKGYASNSAKAISADRTCEFGQFCFFDNSKF